MYFVADHGNMSANATEIENANVSEKESANVREKENVRENANVKERGSVNVKYVSGSEKGNAIETANGRKKNVLKAQRIS